MERLVICACRKADCKQILPYLPFTVKQFSHSCAINLAPASKNSIKAELPGLRKAGDKSYICLHMNSYCEQIQTKHKFVSGDQSESCALHH